VPQITEEQMAAFQAFLARFAPAPRREGPDPQHRGVIDPNYVRPAPREYPRMMHHASGMTKIVESKREQDALGEGWSVAPQKRRADWKTKMSEVFTKSGFQVRDYHIEFLKASEIIGVATLADAAAFIDMLNAEQQTQFFEEAESFQPQVEKKKRN